MVRCGRSRGLRDGETWLYELGTMPTPIRRASAKTKAKLVSTRAGSRLRAQARRVDERLRVAIPEAFIELDFDSPYELLIATILSAQSTDRATNRVMPELLRRFPDPAELARAPREELEILLKPTGFFRSKAKAIRGASRIITERFGGKVPRTMEELCELPGVARKTANIVLGVAYGIPSGFAVDTHVGRVSRRLALTEAEDPAQVEADLCAEFPRGEWMATSLRLVLHGRYVCTARAPRCAMCPLNEICPSRQAEPEGNWQERAEREGAFIELRREGGGRLLAQVVPDPTIPGRER